MGDSLNNLERGISDTFNNGILTIETYLLTGFNSIGQGLTNLFNELETGLNNLTNSGDIIINWIQNFFVGLSNTVIEVLETVLVPRQDYFNEKIGMLQTTFDSRFNFNLDLIIPSYSFNQNQSFSIPFLMGTTINFDWFNPYRFQFKGMLSVVFYSLTVIFVINNLKELYT